MSSMMPIPPVLVGGDTEVDEAIQPATYFATDPEGDTITWTLSGDDAGSFVIGVIDTDTGEVVIDPDTGDEL